jgi:hypothetical protein
MIYFGDHPPPHVHARIGRPGSRGATEARILIDTGELIDGVLPAPAASQVRSWCQRHRDALLADWDLTQADRHPTGSYD